jgi:hypothetical protein
MASFAQIAIFVGGVVAPVNILLYLGFRSFSRYMASKKNFEPEPQKEENDGDDMTNIAGVSGGLPPGSPQIPVHSDSTETFSNNNKGPQASTSLTSRMAAHGDSQEKDND